LALKGVKRQSLYFSLKKDTNAIKAILGILKVDCAYVPLDIHAPSSRLKSILKSTAATAIIVDNYSQSIFEALIPNGELPLLINVDRLVVQDKSAVEYKNLSVDIAQMKTMSHCVAGSFAFPVISSCSCVWVTLRH
jgi:D-alanine--poly(phosphoribitol) ligase subunit 1